MHARVHAYFRVKGTATRISSVISAERGVENAFRFGRAAAFVVKPRTLVDICGFETFRTLQTADRTVFHAFFRASGKVE